MGRASSLAGAAAAKLLALAPALLLALLLGGCTEANPAYQGGGGGSGGEGQACRPDGSCDTGLTCVANICRVGGAAVDGGVVIADSGAPRDGPDGQRDGGGGGGDANSGRVDGGGCPTYPAPNVSAPSSTPYDRFPLRANAPGADAFEIAGGGQVQRINASGGAICVEIKLPTNATLNFTVRAVYGDCRSADTPVTVVSAPVRPVNLAKNRPARTGSNISDPLSRITDGLFASHVEWSFFDVDALGSSCDNYAWVAIDLGGPRDIVGMTVHYPNTPNFNRYLRCWKLLASTRNTPRAPSDGSTHWTLVKEAQNSPAGTLSVTFPQQRARHVGVLMYEDGGGGLNETFQISEIEIWGPPNVAPYQGCN